ncbi:hypothetical protein HQN60_06185 [Deefgea piscis]|uniref:Uncharacterized protein n=1 Tax=Deefgea piscis TaxID=2739061 RepID=A0A6M8SQC7_9NEIS|nr:hypothetical protein [Deefgea piscis]QKJ66324.1 hypothetical protein HQN60_06185 [Deefgea piscis]
MTTSTQKNKDIKARDVAISGAITGFVTKIMIDAGKGISQDTSLHYLFTDQGIALISALLTLLLAVALSWIGFCVDTYMIKEKLTKKIQLLKIMHDQADDKTTKDKIQKQISKLLENSAKEIFEK